MSKAFKHHMLDYLVVNAAGYIEVWTAGGNTETWPTLSSRQTAPISNRQIQQGS